MDEDIHIRHNGTMIRDSDVIIETVGKDAKGLDHRCPWFLDEEEVDSLWVLIGFAKAGVGQAVAILSRFGQQTGDVRDARP